VLSPVYIQNQNSHFSVLGICKIINSLPLRRKLLRNFLLRVRSNKPSKYTVESTNQKYKSKVQIESTNRKYKSKVQIESTNQKYKSKVQIEITYPDF
jgi:hypothetical protein